MSPDHASLHCIHLRELPEGMVEEVLDLTARLKNGNGGSDLAGRTVGLLFFRGSLRTRISLEVAMHQLGGQTVNLTSSSDFWELESRHGTVMDGIEPEHVQDAAAALSRYVDALAIRPAPQGRSWEVDRRDESIRTWARWSGVPVLNLESALWHPLQGLADLFTMRETLGDLAGKRLAVTWTRSPTPPGPAPIHSVVQAALAAGMQVAVAHPPGFDLDEGVLAESREAAAQSGGELTVGLTQQEAAEGAHVVYARSWQSLELYGNPTLAASRTARLDGWRVDEKLMARGTDARLLHPMPVRRNLEVTDEVLDGARSLVYAQAENRLHTQKALLAHLLRD